MLRILPFFVVLTACTTFPALDGTISDAARDAPYPTLSPIPVVQVATGDAANDLQARITALQSRADRLRAMEVGALQ